jgi:hypothetical protein
MPSPLEPLATRPLSLDEYRAGHIESWSLFSGWYRELMSRFPDQFPPAMLPLMWQMGHRGWEYLEAAKQQPPAEILMGVPDDCKPWYNLNITTHPFVVVVGEVCTILTLADMGLAAFEFARRMGEIVESDDDFDPGLLFMIALDYIKPTTIFSEETTDGR